MTRHWTNAELTDALQNMTVICDTREQNNKHILQWLEENNVPYITRKLDVGDYSAQLGDQSLEQSVVIERKHTLDEIAGNFTVDRERFEREFLRAKAMGTKVFLMIEDSNWNDLYLGNYRSKVQPFTLAQNLMSWRLRYNISVDFCTKDNAPRILYGTLRAALREELLHGKCC